VCVCMEELDKLTESIYKKMQEARPFEEVELLLLFIERLFYLSWDSKGGYQGGFDLRFKRTPLKGRVDKILIIQPSSIGDVVYSLPLVRGLREQYPKATLSFLVEETAAPIVTCNPNLDEVIVLPRGEWVEEFKRSVFKEVVSKVTTFIKELQKRAFDLVINLHAAPRCAYLTKLLLPKNVSGLSVDEFGQPLMMGSVWIVHKYYITTNALMQDLRRLSLPELYMKIGGGMPKIRKEVPIVIDSTVERRIDDLLGSLGIGRGQLLIGLNPGANFAARRWPPERYARLGDILLREYGAKVIIFGGQDDLELVERIVEMMEEEPVNLAGKTDLKELTALIKRCDHLITNDTGPMHIAGTCKTKTIVLTGPTRTGPYGQGHLLLQADLPCIGCGPTSNCTKGECMSAITVEMVREAFRYQRGELKEPPKFEGVILYASGVGPLSRLFSYAPLCKDKEATVIDLLALASLNLWIEENRTLGLEEVSVGPEELWSELLRHFEKGTLKKVVAETLTALKEWIGMLEEGLGLLLAIDKGEVGLSQNFNELNLRFNATLAGRLLSFLDILYPRDAFASDMEQRIALYQKKVAALKSLWGLVKELESTSNS